MGICLVCGKAEHGECQCAEQDYRFAFDQGYKKALTQAAEICRKEREKHRGTTGHRAGLALQADLLFQQILALQSSPAKEETGEGAL